MEENLSSFSGVSVVAPVKKKKQKNLITVPRVLLAIVLFGLLFFGFYEAMRYFCCTRPLRKAAEAEYEAYHYENDEFADTYLKKTEINGRECEFMIELAKSFTQPPEIKLTTNETVRVGNVDYWLEVSYMPYVKFWDCKYYFICDYNLPAACYIKGYEVTPEGKFTYSEENFSAEDYALPESLMEYYLPMLEELKKEYQHIMDTY